MTQYKKLSKNCDIAVFEEKFQLTTKLPLDPVTKFPTVNKFCQISVQLDENYGYMEIANVVFDIADISYGKYKSSRLVLL